MYPFMRSAGGPVPGGVLAALALAAWFFPGCAAKAKIPVSAISQEWIAVKRAAEAAHEAYFRLFLFFSALIIAVILFLALARREKERAQSREWQSRSFSREAALIQEQERSRIARELHDPVAQDLWRLSLHAGGVTVAVAEKP